jgi:hypothetical protein
VNEVLQWLQAFAFTQIVEMAIYLAAFPSSRPLTERLAIAFGASAITHPMVWFVIPVVLSWMQWWYVVACAETFAVVTELIWLWAFGVRRAPLWSLAANATSFTFGLFCYLLLDW